MILINEFLPDPMGADKGKEWIEIVNTSDDEIDISNWEIQVAGIKFNRAFKFPPESKILPGQYLLICESLVEQCDYFTTQLAIQNGGKETDGIRILNEKLEVVDTVLYDTSNTNNLLNDFGETEKDENIVEMPQENCSLSRRNFLDSNFSKQDFFVTCSPTPGRKNVEIERINISEVSTNYIEFFSSTIPANLSKWYIQTDSEKIFLENGFQNNFFSLNLTKPSKNISLYTPEGNLFDSFSKDYISKNFSYCRLNSNIEEDFVFCEITKNETNELKTWKPINIFETIQIFKNDPQIVDVCVMYKYGDIYIISDETAGIGTQCEDCEVDTCNISEISSTNLEILEKGSLRKIPIEIATKKNYLELLNKVVFLEGIFEKNENDFSIFITETGKLKTKKSNYTKGNRYLLKGILGQEKNNVTLEYPIAVKEESAEILQTLEQTGDPLIILALFFIAPFFLTKIFARIPTIKFKRSSL